MKSTEKYQSVINEVTEALRDPTTALKTLERNLFGGDRPIFKWSWLNQIIAHMEGYEDARSFRAWQKVNRTVKKGEKAFYITKPFTRLIKEKGEIDHVQIMGFGLQPEFGYEQTEGEPLEDIEELSKTAHIPADMVKIAKSIGVSVKADFSSHGEGGSYVPDLKLIKIKSDDTRVIYHELAHAVDHHLGGLDPKKYHLDRGVHECVAEYSSAILERYYDPKSKIEISKGYMSSWSNTTLIPMMNKVFPRVKAIVEFILSAA